METYGLLEGYSFFSKIKESGGAAIDYVIKEQEDKIKRTLFSIERYLPLSNNGKHKSFHMPRQEESVNHIVPKVIIPDLRSAFPKEKKKVIKPYSIQNMVTSNSNSKFKFSTSLKKKADPIITREVESSSEKLPENNSMKLDHHSSIQSFFLTENNECKSIKNFSRVASSLVKAGSVSSIVLKKKLSEASKSLTEPEKLTDQVFNCARLVKTRANIQSKLDKDQLTFDHNRFNKSDKYKQTYIEALKNRLNYIEQDELNSTDSFDKDDLFPTNSPVLESKARIKQIKAELGSELPKHHHYSITKKSEFSMVKKLIHKMSKAS